MSTTQQASDWLSQNWEKVLIGGAVVGFVAWQIAAYYKSTHKDTGTNTNNSDSGGESPATLMSVPELVGGGGGGGGGSSSSNGQYYSSTTQDQNKNNSVPFLSSVHPDMMCGGGTCGKLPF